MSTGASGSIPTVAITGAAGYLGSRVVELFREQGWRVLRLTRDPRGASDAVEFKLGQPVPDTLLRGVNALVHCAYDFSAVTRRDIERVNVSGTRELLAAAERARVSSVTYVSSISAYAGCVSEYGRAKLAAEAMARESGAFVVRPGLMFGDPPGAMFGKLVDAARHKIVPLIGDGSQLQYLVHRDDVADLLVRGATGRIQPAGEPVTIAHPSPWSMRELLRAIARQRGREVVLVPTPWRFIWAALKMAELAQLPINFRSDSVVSLMHQNPAPDLTIAERMGITCRPFA